MFQCQVCAERVPFLMDRLHRILPDSQRYKQHLGWICPERGHRLCPVFITPAETILLDRRDVASLLTAMDNNFRCHCRPVAFNLRWKHLLAAELS